MPLLCEIPLIDPFALAHVPPKAQRRLGAGRRRFIERKQHRKGGPSCRPLAYPELVSLPPIAKKQMHAILIFTDDRLSGPRVRLE
jgi:hypothetical protein